MYVDETSQISILETKTVGAMANANATNRPTPFHNISIQSLRAFSLLALTAFDSMYGHGGLVVEDPVKGGSRKG
jgi:hypothetical protein